MFVLFLAAGQFKSLPALASVQERVDLTLATASAVLVGTCLLGLTRSRRLIPKGWPIRYFLLYLGLLLVLLVSWGTQGGGPSSSEKVARVALFNTIAVIGPLVVMQSQVRVLRFLRLLIPLSVVAIGIALFTSESRLLGVGGETSYQGLGRMAGMGFAVVVANTRHLRLGRRRRWVVNGLLIALLVFAVIATGARQAVLGSMVAIAYSFSYRSPSIKKPRVFSPIRGALMILIATAILLLLVATWGRDLPGVGGGTRISDTVEAVASGDLLLDERFVLWKGGLSDWASHPLTGIGFGNFALVTDSATYEHPHNVVIEMAAELGLLGIIMGVGLLFIPLKLALGGRSRGGIALVAGSAFVFLLTTASVSGDLADNRMLFAVGSVMATTGSFRAQQRGNLPKDELRPKSMAPRLQPVTMTRRT